MIAVVFVAVGALLGAVVLSVIAYPKNPSEQTGWREWN